MDKQRIIQPIGDRIIIPKRKIWMGREDQMPPRILYPKLSKKGILSPGSSGGSASPSGGGTQLLVGYKNLTCTGTRQVAPSDEWVSCYVGFATTVAGTATKGIIRISSVTSSTGFKIAVYESDTAAGAGTLVGTSVEGVPSAGNIEVTFSPGVTIQAAHYYYLAFAVKDADFVDFLGLLMPADNGGYQLDSSTEGTYASPPATHTGHTGDWETSPRISVWLEG